MSKKTEKFKALARNGIRLKIGGKKRDRTPTRFGGEPLAPRDFQWPYFETASFDDPSGEVKSRPLAFLAQFDCAELAKYDKENLLPHRGVLSFFYSVESNRWGFDPADKGCSQVYWFEERDDLVPAPFPQDLSADYRFPALKISMKKEDSYPDYDDLPSEVDSDEYEEFFEELNADEEDSVSKLLGWPNVIQNAMAEECELIAREFYLGGDLREIPQEVREEASRGANDRWRLLFQLDTVEQDDFELMFGDCGRIYFWIRKEDLAARRFDRVWLVLQCC